MDNLTLTDGLILLMFLTQVLWVGFKSYLTKKSSNRADIEDSAQIARITQGVKIEFDKALESHKSDLVQERTKSDWQRDEYKHRVFLFQRLGRLMVSVPSIFKFHHALRFGSSVELALSKIEGLSLANVNNYLQAHKENKNRGSDYYPKVKDVILDLWAITFELDIYFSVELGDSVRAYISAVEDLVPPAINDQSMQTLAKSSYLIEKDLDQLREEIGAAYDGVWMKKIPARQAAAISISIRDELIKQMAVFH